MIFSLIEYCIQLREALNMSLMLQKRKEVKDVIERYFESLDLMKMDKTQKHQYIYIYIYMSTNFRSTIRAFQYQ